MAAILEGGTVAKAQWAERWLSPLIRSVYIRAVGTLLRFRKERVKKMKVGWGLVPADILTA